ncbi:AIPR protein [Pirellula sp. SH-Sr6A]|uniref:AIPR family protein n=1 Tax=Pirellula sp. SH-Sr6A TaxID=1632865 RepID=UPI00078E6675|nr:AIPR family protein [Pirellula sp. SH-Sr6A]AMV32140.1 AIPR protein [Pirellula sp. SH-Sr6A]
MNVEKPYEIDHIPKHLHGLFDGKVPPASSGKTEQERENNFLSRSLAAFSVHKLSGCTLDEAASSIVDGGGDGGIDAVYYSPISNTLWLVQSKFIENGRGEPDLGEASKFKDGIDNLLSGKWNAFLKNNAWARRIPLIKKLMEDQSVLHVKAVLVYSGINAVSEDRLRLFETLESRYNHGDEFLRFGTYSLVSVHDWLTGADAAAGVDRVELEILKPGWVIEPYQTIYGQVRVADVAALYETHRAALVEANLRRYKGLTEVNKRIKETLQAEGKHFFYLNNGLTAYCLRLDVAATDRANTEKKKITARGFSIVNGAQTIGTIHAANAGGDGFVFLKIISLEKCEKEAAFARRITESTNFQNQISPRDFVALDEQHERIALQLEMDGIHYHFKEADDVPEPDATNFTLDEAATALACLEPDKDCDYCSMLLSNRKALWSAEPVYPKDRPQESLCERMFRRDRSSRKVWRAVQLRRIVIERLNGERPAAGARREFYENARWLVLHLLFLREHLEQGETLALTEEEKARAAAQTLEIANAIWATAQEAGFVSATEPYTSPRHFKSVFCNAADCQKLKAGAMRKLNEKPTAIASDGIEEAKV